MDKSKGKVTVNFDFSHHEDGEKIGIWFRDMVRDGTLSVYVAALWETGNAVGYYGGKRERATTAATRELYDERGAAANVATDGKNTDEEGAAAARGESWGKFRVERGNVVMHKVSGKKRCVLEEEFLKLDEWALVCEFAHEDGDFSYMCTNEWCRCRQ